MFQVKMRNKMEGERWGGFWVGIEKVMRAWESCCLRWEKIKDACWWRLSENWSWIRIELNKNFFASHVFFCISVSTEMQAVDWLIFSFSMKMTVNLVLKELYCLWILPCWRGCWIITASDFIVATASVLKLCHPAFTVATEWRRCWRDFNNS